MGGTYPYPQHVMYPLGGLSGNVSFCKGMTLWKTVFFYLGECGRSDIGFTLGFSQDKMSIRLLGWGLEYEEEAPKNMFCHTGC